MRVSVLDAYNGVIITSDRKVYRYSSGSWILIANAGTGLDVDMGPGGSIWGVGTDFVPYAYSGSSWSAFPLPSGEKAITVTVGAVVAVTTTTKKVYYRSGTSGSWTLLSNASLAQVHAAADGSFAYWGVAATDYKGEGSSIWRMRADGSWEKLTSSGLLDPGRGSNHPGFRQVSVGTASNVWLLDMNGFPYQWTGSAWALKARPVYVVGMKPLYLLYAQTRSARNAVLANGSERSSLAANGWQQLGMVGWFWPSSGSGLVPLYRLANDALADHIYTTNATERNNLIASGWRDEGIAGYVRTSPQSADDLPLARHYCPGTGAWAYHVSVADPVEWSRLQGQGCQWEGVQGYVQRPWIILRFLSMNVAGIPETAGDVCTVFGDQETVPRMKDVGKRFFNEDADVIAVNEAFKINFLGCDKDYLQTIMDNSNIPYKSRGPDRSDRPADSGLGILSRYPIAWSAREPFHAEDCAEADCYAAKGVLQVALAHPRKS